MNTGGLLPLLYYYLINKSVLPIRKIGISKRIIIYLHGQRKYRRAKLACFAFLLLIFNV